MSPALQPVDESFFATAPRRWSASFAIHRSAAEVWAGITAERPLSWCRALSGRWTSPAPFGVGTTRRMRVLGALQMQEHFFAWEEGRRYAFHATSMNVPLARRFAEDSLVTPDGPDACRFDWTIAAEPTLLYRLGGPSIDVIVRSLFADTRRHFAAS